MTNTPTAVLIRPDGYVAWVGEWTQLGLADALLKWFGPSLRTHCHDPAPLRSECERIGPFLLIPVWFRQITFALLEVGMFRRTFAGIVLPCLLLHSGEAAAQDKLTRAHWR